VSSETSNSGKGPVILCVLDGWGWRSETSENAIALAKTPNFDRMFSEYPTAFLKTSGLDVGLPKGQMGNSEVGHLNLGAGRIVNQDIVRIDAAIESGKLSIDSTITKLITNVNEKNSTCHLMGLISPGGVHSHQNQIAALAKILNEAGVRVVIHAFLDGRDTPPKSAKEHMRQFLFDIKKYKNVKIGTVSGRFFSMDRDNRWQRIETAYSAIVAAKGEYTPNPIIAIENNYKKNVGDEFIIPNIIGNYSGIQDGDAILMANFRADRVREILTAFLDPKFKGFKRSKTVSISTAVGLVEYSNNLNKFMVPIFPPVKLKNIFAKIISDAGMKQFRIAETEKYAHVTFFFNGGIETPFPGEERLLIPSPSVNTYDQKPEMSAREVTDSLCDAVNSKKFDFIFVNYANPDMVGHTGILKAAILAISTVDECLGRLEKSIKNTGGTLFITADHGNAETMVSPDTGNPFTSHTKNVVPAILIESDKPKGRLLDGRLADVAPTLLQLMSIPKPSQMTGDSLLTSSVKSKNLIPS